MPSSAFRTRAVVTVVACVTAAGCGGGSSKQPPSQRDVAVITASVADIVYQCQAAAAQYIATPDHKALKRDVDGLVSAAARLRADASLQPARGPRTTLRQQLGLAARNLRAGCSPEQATRLDEAVK
jgi:hypothetical protein